MNLDEIFMNRSPTTESCRSPHKYDEEGHETPRIPQMRTSTFDGSSADEEALEKTPRSILNSTHHDEEDEDEDRGIRKVAPHPQKILSFEHFSLFDSWREITCQVFYLSAFAIMGTMLRIYMGRLFGLDCELAGLDTAEQDDFLTPVSSQMCVTSDGKLQRGGALFTDLPANMVGSFLMGILSPQCEEHPLGWLRADHPLQQRTALHIGLKVGLCGCLTTFASWNTQMVVMMAGTDTEFRPQVASVIFGYFIGIATAVNSFIFGRHCFEWMRSNHPLPQVEVGITAGVSRGLEAQGSTESSPRSCCSQWSLQAFLMLFVGGLFSALVTGDVTGNLSYRKMWIASLLAPCGAILRWRLSGLNRARIHGTRLSWFPAGTFSANVIAVVLAALVEALHSRIPDSDLDSQNWKVPVLWAVGVGFAGSLSTVSTLISEMLSRETPRQAHLYWFVTLFVSLLVGLLVYSPIARSD